MNLVKMVMDQLSGETLGQLGSLLGTDANTTQRAATAAAPSILSALAGMASNEDGAKKLTSVLGGVDSAGLGDMASMLGGGDAGALLSKGSGLLGSLFNDNMVSGIASAVSRFTGVNAGVAKSLLAYMLPMVLGKVAGAWKSRGGTTQALQTLFAEQRDNIKSAVPTGLSLADIPGMAEARPAYDATRRSAPERPRSKSAASWLVPLAAVLLGGFFVWQFATRPRAGEPVAENPAAAAPDRTVAMKPALPEVDVEIPSLDDARADVTRLFESLNTTLADVTDAASAERAMPELRDLKAKIDAMNLTLPRLPEASATALRPIIEEQVKVASEKAAAVESMPGISQDFKSLIQQILAAITKWTTSLGG